jgi:dolichol-phosphate mannosyltransferase
MQYEVIIVDDDSKDGTDKVVEALFAKGYPVSLITRTGERGLSSAVIRGFKEAKGDILVCMDADMSHPPEAIPSLLEQFAVSQADCVIGSRYVRGGKVDENWGLFRWFNSKIAKLMARPFTMIKDPMSGFFAIPKTVFEKATQLSPIGYKIGLEIIVKCRCKRIVEVPIHFSNRQFGQSKLNLKEQINYIRHLKRLADFKYGEFSRLLLFCFVGLTGMLIDLTILGIFINMGLSFMAARAMAIWAAMTCNFWFNRRLTLSHSHKTSFLLQYARFTASCIVGAMLSWSISVGLVKMVTGFSKHVFGAAIVGIIVGAASNILFSKFRLLRRS